MCYFPIKHTKLMSKKKDCLIRKQYNVSEYTDMSTRKLLFKWASTKINH
jgi:hypothetical protein